MLCTDRYSWPVAEKADFVNKAQHWDRHNITTVNRRRRPHTYQDVINGHACFRCYRVLPRENFSLSKTARKFAKSNYYHWKPGHPERYCMDCGIKDGIYKPGDTLQFALGELFNLRRNYAHSLDDALVDAVICKRCLQPAGLAKLRPIGTSKPKSGCDDTTADGPGRQNMATHGLHMGLLVVECIECGYVQVVREPHKPDQKCSYCVIKAKHHRRKVKIESKKHKFKTKHCSAIKGSAEVDVFERDEDNILQALGW